MTQRSTLSPSKTVFVGGIPGEIEAQTLANYFGRFGPVVDVAIPRLKTRPGINGGFCFVTFLKRESLRRVLSVGDHFLESRRVSCRAYHPEAEAQALHKNRLSRKLFVKFVPLWMEEPDFRAFFEQFGPLESYHLVRPQRGASAVSQAFSFGYLVFRDRAHSDLLVGKKTIKVGNKKMMIQRFQKNPGQDEPSAMEPDCHTTFNKSEGPKIRSNSFYEDDHLLKPTNRRYRHKRIDTDFSFRFSYSGDFQDQIRLHKPVKYRFNVLSKTHFSSPEDPYPEKLDLKWKVLWLKKPEKLFEDSNPRKTSQRFAISYMTSSQNVGETEKHLSPP